MNDTCGNCGLFDPTHCRMGFDGSCTLTDEARNETETCKEWISIEDIDE